MGRKPLDPLNSLRERWYCALSLVTVAVFERLSCMCYLRVMAFSSLPKNSIQRTEGWRDFLPISPPFQPQLLQLIVPPGSSPPQKGRSFFFFSLLLLVVVVVFVVREKRYLKERERDSERGSPISLSPRSLLSIFFWESKLSLVFIGFVMEHCILIQRTLNSTYCIWFIRT